MLDFQGLLKSGVWVLLAGGKRKIGFSNARELSHIFLNEKLPSYDPEMHAVDRYLALARHAGGAAGAAGAATTGGRGAGSEKILPICARAGGASEIVVAATRAARPVRAMVRNISQL